MGLRIQSKRIGVKIVTVVALFALAMQPLYNLAASQVVDAKTPTGGVVINEIARVGSSEQWIELYNASDAVVDMSDWTFGSGNTIGKSTTIAAKGFYVKNLTNLQSKASTLELRTSVKKNSEAVDTVAYPAMSNGQSYARTVDGGAMFEMRDSAHMTRGSSNTATAPQPPIVTPPVDVPASDTTVPKIIVKDGYVGDIDAQVFSNVSFQLYDAHKVDKYSINGTMVNVANNEWSDANFENIKQYLTEGAGNTLVVYDKAGNSASYMFVYDTLAPSGSLAYSNNNGATLTNANVTATLTTTETVRDIAGWTRVTNDTFTKVFTDNGPFAVTVTDLAGNSSDVSGEVKRIDRNAPTISGFVNGSAIQAPVTISIFDPKYQGYDGFDANQGLTVNGVSVRMVADADKTYAYTIMNAGNYDIVATDKAGNVSSATVTVLPSGNGVIGGDDATAVSDSTTETGTSTPFVATAFAVTAPRPNSLLGIQAFGANNDSFAVTKGDNNQSNGVKGAASINGEAADVKGAETAKSNWLDTAASYWWLIAAVIVAGGIWWFIAARRRREDS